LGAALAQHWPRLAADWRAQQLGYSWLLAASGRPSDFWTVTQDALDWALEASGLDDPALRARLLQLYWELPAYPEAPPILARLKDQGYRTAILSNGSADMLEAAVNSADIGELLDEILTAQSSGTFKPRPAVYDLVGQALGTQPAEVLFVSANGWDAAFGALHGFTTVWINRNGAPVERLPGRPHHILPDLSGIPDLVARL